MYKTYITILRLEQFYPFPESQLKKIFQKYRQAKKWLWVQEEPQNMGGWQFIKPRLESITQRTLTYIGRKPASSPATGFPKIYKMQQDGIVDQAIGVSTKTWQNTISNARNAMVACGIFTKRQRRSSDLSPAWRRLWELVRATKDKSLLSPLPRFIHFIDRLNVAPDALDRAHEQVAAAGAGERAEAQRVEHRDLAREATKPGVRRRQLDPNRREAPGRLTNRGLDGRRGGSSKVCGGACSRSSMPCSAPWRYSSRRDTTVAAPSCNAARIRHFCRKSCSFSIRAATFAWGRS